MIYAEQKGIRCFPGKTKGFDPQGIFGFKVDKIYCI